MSEKEVFSASAGFLTAHVEQAYRGEMSAKLVADITCAAYKCRARNMNAYELTLAAGDDLRSI